MPFLGVGSLGRDVAPQVLSRPGRKDSCIFREYSRVATTISVSATFTKKRRCVTN